MRLPHLIILLLMAATVATGTGSAGLIPLHRIWQSVRSVVEGDTEPRIAMPTPGSAAVRDAYARLIGGMTGPTTSEVVGLHGASVSVPGTTAPGVSGTQQHVEAPGTIVPRVLPGVIQGAGQAPRR